MFGASEAFFMKPVFHSFGFSIKVPCVSRSVARDKATLSSLGVTHILNAAAGRHRINTGPQFYSDLEVEYHGVEAADHPEFNLRPFFDPAAQFIDSALRKNGWCCKKTSQFML